MQNYYFMFPFPLHMAVCGRWRQIQELPLFEIMIIPRCGISEVDNQYFLCHTGKYNETQR